MRVPVVRVSVTRVCFLFLGLLNDERLRGQQHRRNRCSVLQRGSSHLDRIDHALRDEVVDGDHGPIFRPSVGGELHCPPTSHRGAAVLGIRPEAVGLAAMSHGTGPECEIEAVERYGDRGDAVLRLAGGDHRVVHRGAATDLPGEGLKVRLATLDEGVHLFAADDGRRLASGGDEDEI